MPRVRTVNAGNGAVALVERQCNGRTYSFFPGGGAEQGESTREAALREAEKELGLLVEIGDLLAGDIYEGALNASSPPGLSVGSSARVAAQSMRLKRPL